MNREAIFWTFILIIVLTILGYHLVSTIEPSHTVSALSEHAGATKNVE